LLSTPQTEFPFGGISTLIPVCLSSQQLGGLLGAIFIAADEGVYPDNLRDAHTNIEEAMAFLDLPENAPCFPLLEIIQRLAGGSTSDGMTLLEELDTRLGTTYWYHSFCNEVFDSLTVAGSTAETLYAHLVAKYALYCGIATFPDFPTPEEAVLSELGATPTQAELDAFLASAGITPEPEYDWEHTLDLTAGQSSFVAWTSTPYANIPAQRSRFLYVTSTGLRTSYGTSGEPGSSTQRHYLYAKRGFSARDLTHIRIVFDNPQTQDATFVHRYYNSGVAATVSVNLTIPASTTGHVYESDITTFADLFALNIEGGSAQNASHTGITVKEIRFRGLGTNPF